MTGLEEESLVENGEPLAGFETVVARFTLRKNGPNGGVVDCANLNLCNFVAGQRTKASNDLPLQLGGSMSLSITSKVCFDEVDTEDEDYHESKSSSEMADSDKTSFSSGKILEDVDSAGVDSKYTGTNSQNKSLECHVTDELRSKSLVSLPSVPEPPIDSYSQQPKASSRKSHLQALRLSSVCTSDSDCDSMQKKEEGGSRTYSEGAELNDGDEQESGPLQRVKTSKISLPEQETVCDEGIWRETPTLTRVDSPNRLVFWNMQGPDESDSDDEESEGEGTEMPTKPKKVHKHSRMVVTTTKPGPPAKVGKISPLQKSCMKLETPATTAQVMPLGAPVSRKNSRVVQKKKLVANDVRYIDEPSLSTSPSPSPSHDPVEDEAKEKEEKEDRIESKVNEEGHKAAQDVNKVQVSAIIKMKGSEGEDDEEEEEELMDEEVRFDEEFSAMRKAHRTKGNQARVRKYSSTSGDTKESEETSRSSQHSGESDESQKGLISLDRGSEDLKTTTSPKPSSTPANLSSDEHICSLESQLKAMGEYARQLQQEIKSSMVENLGLSRKNDKLVKENKELKTKLGKLEKKKGRRQSSDNTLTPDKREKRTNVAGRSSEERTSGSSSGSPGRVKASDVLEERQSSANASSSGSAETGTLKRTDRLIKQKKKSDRSSLSGDGKNTLMRTDRESPPRLSSNTKGSLRRESVGKRESKKQRRRNVSSTSSGSGEWNEEVQLRRSKPGSMRRFKDKQSSTLQQQLDEQRKENERLIRVISTLKEELDREPEVQDFVQELSETKILLATEKAEREKLEKQVKKRGGKKKGLFGLGGRGAGPHSSPKN